MNPIRRIGAAVATLTSALFALTTASAAYASLPPHGGGPAPAPARIWPIVIGRMLVPAYPSAPAPPPARIWPIVIGGVPVPAYPSAPARAPTRVHTIVSGGMPGWQITLIAIGAALAAAAVAVLLDRAQMTRKTHATTA